MIIPSIDLSKGKAVQLEQGRKKMLEREDVTALAQEFTRYGEIAVIDLDAALGKGDNRDLIKTLCKNIPCRVGGGIRTVKEAQDIISRGAEKVIIGTKAVEGGTNHPFLTNLKAAIGRERIIVALDFKGREVVTRGWRHNTELSWADLVKELEGYASEILFTNTDKEGLMAGTDLAAIEEIKNSTSLEITAAGGVSTLEEISSISRLDVDIQLGMAIYTGKISLEDAFIASCRWDGLIPTIICDPASQVLMLAYSSPESLKKTLTTDEVWFYSRSRKKLWKKGETSGNCLDFQRIRIDCDGDTLLITASPRGPACHTQSYSCFGGKRFSLEELWILLQGRFAQPVPGSYTSSLDRKSIGLKLKEEAAELDEAETEEEIVWEAADLMYFTLAKMAFNGIPLSRVFRELQRRRSSPRRKNNE